MLTAAVLLATCQTPTITPAEPEMTVPDRFVSDLAGEPDIAQVWIERQTDPKPEQ